VLMNGCYSTEYKRDHANRLASLTHEFTGLAVSEQALQLAELYTRAEKTMILVDGYRVDGAELGLIAELSLMTEPVGRIIVVTPGVK